MSPPLDELYLRWLYGQVSPVTVKNPSRTYWSFIKQLFEKEFVWLVPNDDNRVSDGIALRQRFIQEWSIDEHDDSWLALGCSVLEMLVGLSQRIAFEVDDEVGDWFWKLIENLNLSDLSDRQYNDSKKHEIDEALDILIWRQYHPDGRGGLFPLMAPQEDQRDVEIWYQMGAYLVERYI